MTTIWLVTIYCPQKGVNSGIVNKLLCSVVFLKEHKFIYSYIRSFIISNCFILVWVVVEKYKSRNIFWIGSEKKPENLEETHVDTERTCKTLLGH